MGRRLQKPNNYEKCYTNGNPNTRHVDNFENTHTRKRKMTYSNENKRSEESNRSYLQSRDIFPVWLPWILFPLILFLRLTYVLKPTNWWILHPDEVFQTMEVAHSEAFGYGFRPYEYLPPPNQDFLNSTVISDAHAHAMQNGMYSLRSFLLPKLLAAIMRICDICGSTTTPFLVVKVFHVTVTSLLPLAVHKFVRSLHPSEDIACLSAILVCSSVTLNVLATHTFINSFLSSFFFLSLIPLITSLKSLESSDDIHKSTGLSFNASIEHSKRADGVHNMKTKYGEEAEHQNNKTTEMTIQASNFSRENVSSHHSNLNVIKSNGNISNIREKQYKGIDENKANQRETNLDNFYKILTASKEAISGIGISLCIYIRVDLSIVLFLILASSSFHNFGNISKGFVKSNKLYFLGMFSGIIFGGYCDYFAYGKWLWSPYQWYKFNILKGLAGNYFGVESVFFYLLKLYQNEPLVCVSVTIIIIDIIQDVREDTTMKAHLSKNRYTVICISMFLAFSASSHKELRFIQNAVIFLYISVSVAIFSLIKRFSQNQNSHQYSIYSVYLFIALFTSSHIYTFCNMTIANRANWAYGKITFSHETNMCLDFIRQQKDVSGVFMDRSVYMSGAYSILHHDVPIFALNIFEFMEYKSDKHLDAAINLNLSLRKYKGFSTFKDISDFVSIYNAHYLFRKIRSTPLYNFLILQTNTYFNDAGYDEVFRSGNSKVMFRSFEKEKEAKIQGEIANTKIFLNATVLEYEGSWLKHYGLYSKAEQRLMMANKIDPKRIYTFRILLEMYSKLKHSDDYNNVLMACLQLFSKSECLKPYVPVGFNYGK